MINPKNFVLEHPHPSKECKPCTVGRPIVYFFFLFLSTPIIFYYVWNLFPELAIKDLHGDTLLDIFINYVLLFQTSFLGLTPELDLISLLLCTHCLLMLLIRVIRVRVTIYGRSNWILWLAQLFISVDAFACALLYDTQIFRIFIAVAATVMVVYLEFLRLRASRRLWNATQFPDYR